jgi:hypothetical protein
MTNLSDKAVARVEIAVNDVHGMQVILKQERKVHKNETSHKILRF